MVLHWNTDYAEIPRKELPNVVEKSYNAMLSALEDFEGTICCNITGHTVEYLQKYNPDTIDTLKSLISKGTIELLGTGYSHPILPLIHPRRQIAQMGDQLNLMKKAFSTDLSGFWPPELAVSPTVLAAVKQLGLEWVTVDHEHLLQAQAITNIANPFEKRSSSSTEILVNAYFSPNPVATLRNYVKALRYLVRMNKSLERTLEMIQFTTNDQIKAVLSSQSWWNSTRFAISKTTSLYKLSKHMKLIKQSKNPLLPIYTSDIEFFGYREFGGKIPQPELLIDFLKKLQKQEIPTISPSTVPPEEWNAEPVFVGTGSWSENKSFSIWTDSEDNRELARELQVIYDELSKQHWNQDLIKKVEPYLRIAENSDARGWGPIPERKLEAFTAIQTLYQELGI